MKYNRLSRIEKYFNSEQNDRLTIGGINAKSFFRLDDDKRSHRSCFYIDHNIDPKDVVLPKKSIKDSAIFGELFSSLMTIDNHYITCFNELFDHENNEYYIPKFVSVLCKFMMHEGRRFSEIFGSRFSNLLGIDTVYNLSIDKSFSQEDFPDLNLKSNRLVASVDFLPSDYESVPFNDLIGKHSSVTSLKIFLMLIETALPEKIKITYGFLPSKNQIEAIKKGFVKQYLFRRTICGDTDFATHNSGVMVNKKTKDIKLLPNFDMEFLFEESSGEYAIDRIFQTMHYCIKNYPDILHELMSKIYNIQKTGTIKKLERYSSSSAPEFTDNHLELVNSRLNLVRDCYEKSMNPYFDRTM